MELPGKKWDWIRGKVWMMSKRKMYGETEADNHL